MEIAQPTWFNAPKGARVLWTHKIKGNLHLKLGTILNVGSNKGKETLVTVVLEETFKPVKIRIGELTWAPKKVK